MKILRLIILIPAIIVAMFLTNILTDLLLGIFNYFTTEPSPFSFIWDSFLKSGVITGAAIYSAMYIYPYEKKYPALIIVTIMYISIYVLLSNSFFYLSEYLKDFHFSRKTIISLVAQVVGNVVVLGYYWVHTYLDEIKSSK